MAYRGTVFLFVEFVVLVTINAMYSFQGTMAKL